jgi:hypothetical protein
MYLIAARKRPTKTNTIAPHKVDDAGWALKVANW